MADLEHDALTDADGIHEPKGAGLLVGGASDVGKIYQSDGAGSGSWALPTLQGVYGGISSHDSSIAVATIGTTQKKLAAFDTNDVNDGATPDHTADQITVLTAGDYEVTFTISFSTTAAPDAGLYEFHLRLDAVEQPYGCYRQMSGTADTGSASFTGMLNIAANEVVTVYVESDNGADTDDIVVNSATLSIKLLKAD